jgi:hypothetical protein
MIDDCAPDPVEGECELLDEAECVENPLCADYRGRRIEPGTSCYEADVFAICFAREYACGDMVSPMKGPDGACWLFFEACFDGEAGWAMFPPDCPTYEEWDAIAECG